MPSCQACNRAKGTLQPVAGTGMLHGYHQATPPSTFLVAEVAYGEGSLEITFSIDDATVDPALAARLRFQLERLRLNERHPDAINVFLLGLKPSITFFRGMAQERELIGTWLAMAADTYDGDFGLNHWRAAVLRGLAACDAFVDDPSAYLDWPPAALHAA